jgi:hypothetical protein
MCILQESLASIDFQSLLKPFTSRTGRHVRDAIARMWAKMHSPIYSFRFLLDPEFADVSTYGQYTLADVMGDWHDVVDLWFPGKQEGQYPSQAIQLSLFFPLFFVCAWCLRFFPLSSF